MFDNEKTVRHIKYQLSPEGGGEQLKAPRYLHQYTWEGLLATKDPVIDEHGKLWTGPGRKYDMEQPWYQKQLFLAWQQAFKTRQEIPADAMADFQIKKFYIEPAKVEKKPFVWSFSALSQFATCPRQFAAQRIYKTLAHQETEATRWGTRAHEALERAGKGEATAEDIELIQQQNWESYVEVVRNAQGDKFFEHKYGISKNWLACDFFGADVWGRGVADVLIVNGDKATILDYKTGKVKDDPFQLQVFCLFTALAFPQVQTFNAKFIWLKHKEITGLPAPLSRRDILPVMQEVKNRVSRIEEAVEHDVFAMRPSGLCRGWCGVADCPHARG